jgi:hypothetical protein
MAVQNGGTARLTIISERLHAVAPGSIARAGG